MNRRVTVTMNVEAAEQLLELAGSQRRQGEYLSELIHAVYESREMGMSSLATEEQRLKMAGMIMELSEMRNRVEALELVSMATWR